MILQMFGDLQQLLASVAPSQSTENSLFILIQLWFISDLTEAIDQELTHSDMMTFGFYPKRFPEFWLL